MRRAMRALATVVAVVALLATAGVAMVHLSPTPGGGTEADAAARAPRRRHHVESTVGPWGQPTPSRPAARRSSSRPRPRRTTARPTSASPRGPHRDVAVIPSTAAVASAAPAATWADGRRSTTTTGYVTLSVDYLVFGQTTRSPVYPGREQDVEGLSVQWVRDHADELGVELDRIVVHGSSAGSRLGGQVYVSGTTLLLQGPRCGPPHPTTSTVHRATHGYCHPACRRTRSGTTAGGVQPRPDVRERWKKANSVINAEGAHGPALLVHGEGGRGDPGGPDRALRRRARAGGPGRVHQDPARAGPRVRRGRRGARSPTTGGLPSPGPSRLARLPLPPGAPSR